LPEGYNVIHTYIHRDGDKGYTALDLQTRGGLVSYKCGPGALVFSYFRFHNLLGSDTFLLMTSRKNACRDVKQEYETKTETEIKRLDSSPK